MIPDISSFRDFLYTFFHKLCGEYHEGGYDQSKNNWPK